MTTPLIRKIVSYINLSPITDDNDGHISFMGTMYCNPKVNKTDMATAILTIWANLKC